MQWPAAGYPIAEEVGDNPEYRKDIRQKTIDFGLLVSKASTGNDEGALPSLLRVCQTIKLTNHRLLAINRGEKEGFLSVKIDIDEEKITNYLFRRLTPKHESPSTKYVKLAAEDSYKRLIAPSISTEIRNMLTENAEEASIKVFNQNLSGLLLQPPIKRIKSLWALTRVTEPGAKSRLWTKQAKSLTPTLFTAHYLTTTKTRLRKFLRI